MRSIALEWTPTYDERIEGYYLYRGEQTGALKRVAVVKDRYSSHYIDKNLKPNTLYRYRISAYAISGAESKPSPVAEVKTLPIPDSVSFIEAIDHLPREVKLIWRPHPYQRVEWYIVERSEPGKKEWKEVAQIKGRLNAEYIDKNLKDNHIYLYRVRVKTCDGIVSKPSKIVKASTKPRPTIVRGLQATKNLPKKVILRWRPNPEPDIVYYKVYKSVFEIGPYLSIAKTKATEYIDLMDEDGVKRYYKVTAVDKDGLESFKQDVPVVGTTLPKPLPPVIVEKRLMGNTLFLHWESPDKRAVEYMIKKRVKQGFLDEKVFKFTHITSTSFSDAGLMPGVQYIYEIFAIDKYGLVSKPSEKIEIKIEQR